MEKVLKTKPKLLPNPSREEVKIQSGLLPKVTGARSWKRLYQMSYFYVIVQTEKRYTLEIPRLAPKGGWLFDPNKRKSFPLGTDLSLVIQALLDDLATRSK